MPVARSMEQLQKQLMDEMQKAMNQVNKKSVKRIDNAILYFYSGGTPVMYQRTGHLMDSREVTPVVRGGNSVSFIAYLNGGAGGYATGKRPSMQAVLELTNNGGYTGLRPAVGNTHWWDKAEENIESDFYSIFGKYFK